MSTVDRIQAAVMNELIRGEHAPGTRLGQDDLAARLGVSKIPVREALQRLAGLGLLRFEQNRGATIPRLTAAEATEIFALRRAIEPVLLRQALPRLTIVDLAEAELALRAGPDRSTTEDNWVYHRALYRPAGWDRGLAIAEILHAAVAPYVLLYTGELGGADDSAAEHEALLAACRRGAAAEALGLLSGHIDRAEAALVDLLTTRTT